MSTTMSSQTANSTREFNCRIVEHRREGEPSRFTIGVWHKTELRAICHTSSVSAALLALSSEMESVPRSVPSIAFPIWSDIRDLVQRLNDRGDADSSNAAGAIEDLHARLHNAVSSAELLADYVTKLGALLEEAAAHSRSIGDATWAAVALPEAIWFRLLALYRGRQESNQIYRELQLLREIAGITAQTLRTIENWLGHAGTRESAMDSLWRLARILEGAGHKIPTEGLEWRGQLVRALEESGIGMGEDGALRLRQQGDRCWQPATGPLVKDLLHAERQTM
jgi:hypothetical protein